MKRPYESGSWKYNISVPSEDTGKSAVVIVHLNVKPNGITLQGFLDEPAMFRSVKARYIYLDSELLAKLSNQ